jgi:predicted Zn-dependent protease
MRKINLKFFLVLMTAAGAVAGALAGVHYIQYHRIAAALLWQANRAEEEGQVADAARFLQRYLEFRPREIEATARLGLALTSEQYSGMPRARLRGLNLLDNVLTRATERSDLRRRAVKTALELRRLKMARDHLAILWKEAMAAEKTLPPTELGELEAFWGQLLDAEGKAAEAMDYFRKAVVHQPEDQESHQRLAYLLRRQRGADKVQADEDIAEADRLMDNLVARNAESARAYLTRWRYRRDFDLLREAGVLQSDRLARAAEDVEAALKRAPDSPEVLLAAADLERLRAQLVAADPETDKEARDKAVEQHRDRAYQQLQRGLHAASPRSPTAETEGMRFQLLWHLGNLLLDDPRLPDSPEAKQAAAEAEQAIARLRKSKGPSAAADFLQARLYLRARRWTEAAALFEQSRPLFAQQADLAAQTDVYLGQCYEQLDEPNQMYAAYSRVAAWNPGSLPARLGMASAQWAMGRLDEAATQYRAALERGAPPRVWLDLARVEIRRQLELDQRDWKTAEKTLDRAAKADPEALEPSLLRAEMLTARGDLAEAETLLKKLEKEHPRQAVVRAALAYVVERKKDRPAAVAILDQATKDLGDEVEIRLAQAYFLATDGPAAVEKIGKLKEGMETFAVRDRDRLLGGLAEACLKAGDTIAARGLLTELVGQPSRRGDLRLRMLLFDLALRDGDEAGMKQALDDLRSVEPGGGPLTRFGQAMQLITRARKNPAEREPLLGEARLHLDRAAALRPSWPVVSLARAEIDELLGNPEQAITHLKAAIDQGENTPRVVQRLVEALYRRQRYAEAGQELERLRKSLFVNSELGRLAAGVALRRGELTRALELARDAVKDDSTNFRDQLWYGQLLAAASAPTEAEHKLRRAALLAPQEPEPWVALVQFLTSQKRTEDARAAIEQAGKRVAPAKAPLALAQCAEALGDTAGAARQYAAALEKRPDDVTVLRPVASFQLRSGRVREATPLLERVVDGKIKATPADVEWARFGLAVVLSANGDHQRFRRALDLIGLQLDDNGQLAREKETLTAESTDARRARARVLATRGQRQFRDRAIELLEDLGRRQALTPDDRFVLALLYEAAGAGNKAHDQLRDLVLTQTQTPQYLGHYAQALLRRRDFDQAAAWIDRLETLERQREAAPNTFGAVELRARLFEAKGEGSRALDLLRTHTRRKGASPDDVLLVVASLGRQKLFPEALTLCEVSWGRCRPEQVGAASVALLRAMRATDEQCRRIQGRLQSAIDAQAAGGREPSPALLMHLADLHDQLGHYRDSEELYRRILRGDPNNLVALNNLAWLLVVRAGKADEALPLITTAVNGNGRRPDLLDTRGLVYLALGRTDQAVADLKEATAEAPTATRLFHLARAHWKASDRDAAVKALRQAKELGLETGALHPIEQQACRELQTELRVQ